MFKQHSKKIIAASFLLMSIFAFTSPVFAYNYKLSEVGDTVMEYSDTEIKGNIFVTATHYPQYYRGELEFTLQKKGIFGTYSNYDKPQTYSTYGGTKTIADWHCNTKTMYRGFIELTKADSPTRFSSISGDLYLETNNN